jgi:hypothetical protein
MDSDKIKDEVFDIIKSKSTLKRDVFELSKERFKVLKKCMHEFINELGIQVDAVDPRLEISYRDLGDYYAQLTIAGDTLMFALHTNVFFFPDSSPHWDTHYLKEKVGRGYCGTIQVYNFLADSVRFNRQEDAGYLIARLFLNAENHFFVEGKKELGPMFNNFINDEFTEQRIMDFLGAVVRHALNFELYVPNYNTVSQISLGDANSLKDNITLKTGKRLGFQFGMGEDSVEA